MKIKRRRARIERKEDMERTSSNEFVENNDTTQREPAMNQQRLTTHLDGSELATMYLLFLRRNRKSKQQEKGRLEMEYERKE